MRHSLTTVDPKSRLSEHLRHWVADLRPIPAIIEAPPDSTLKYVAYDQTGRRTAVVIVSPEAFPKVVTNELERKVLARRARGPLGGVIFVADRVWHARWSELRDLSVLSALI